LAATRFVLPPHGNPMRPVTLLLAGFFTLALVVFPILMAYVGLGMGSMILIALVILVTAAACLGFTIWMANSVERDRIALDSADAWASWWLSVDEYRRFVASERRRSLRWAITYLVLGLGLAAFFSFRLEDKVTATIMVVVFLIVVVLMVTLGGPPWRATDSAREVRIGPRGVQALGRYTPMEATLTRLHSVALEQGDPAMITFQIKSGRQFQYIRIPVTQGRWEDAVAITRRFNEQTGATGP
jgi:hypothetical protein